MKIANTKQASTTYYPFISFIQKLQHIDNIYTKKEMMARKCFLLYEALC